MYIQPHLNGLRPDLVLLNLKVGIAGYEIKDWSPTTIRRSIGWDRTIRNPSNQTCRYKDEILELYCPRLHDRLERAAKQAITAGLIFTKVDQAEVVQILSHHPLSNMRKYLRYYHLVCSDNLEEKSQRDFPERATQVFFHYV